MVGRIIDSIETKDLNYVVQKKTNEAFKFVKFGLKDQERYIQTCLDHDSIFIFCYHYKDLVCEAKHFGYYNSIIPSHQINYYFSQLSKNKEEQFYGEGTAEVSPGSQFAHRQIAFTQHIKEMSLVFVYEGILPYNSYKFNGLTRVIDTLNRSKLSHLDFGAMLQKKKK